MSATQTPEISSKDKGNETEDPHHTDASAETSQQAESKEDPSKTPSNTLTPASQPVRLTRKRAASLMARGETRHPEPLSLTSAPIPPRIGDSASQVCLCQPEPKVRRPRNAFILYRQHYQASVVAQNPGLANPEISKIIGEQWRQQPPGIKNEWKFLAEEEKLRHQQQYPDYRYQPRRSGRGSSVLGSVSTSTSNSGDIPKCIKCGGRSIATPSTPLTPFTPSTGTSSPLPPLTPSSSGESRFLPLSNVPMAAPPNLRPRISPSPGGMGVLQIASLRDQQDEEGLTPLSPNKKRRLNAGIYTQNGAGNGTGTPFPFPTSARRTSLPRPNAFARLPLQMAPPPRPGRNDPGHPDPSLTLAPLQTSQERSLEAMISTIPYVNKIRVLLRASPPLKTPAPTSPPHAVRGAIIAVDGTDQETNTTIVSWLQEFLQSGHEGNKYAVRVVESSDIPFPEKSDNSTSNQSNHNNYIAYYKSIIEWHTLSAELEDYITTDPGLPPENRLSSNPSPRPVVLINRYQTTFTDMAATHIAIEDAYAPTDHWQWMATKWRGIVGPDITIYVSEASPEELQNCIDVEVRGDTNLVIVRKEVGRPVEDRTMRRLGFEVSEWIRGSGKEDGPASAISPR